MLRHLIGAAAVLSLLCPASALAQEEEMQQPTTVVLSYWKCDYGELGAIGQVSDSILVPAAQELVNEGKWFGFGVLFHEWSDEWNYVTYYVAQDKAAFFSGWEEWFSRLNERHPDLFSWFTDRCTEHKDNIYAYGPRTTPPSQ